MAKKITIRLSQQEADILTDFIADASWFTPNWAHELKMSDFIKFGEDYKIGTMAGDLIDDVWAKIAHKIGKTDSCDDCKAKKPTPVCKKRFR